MLTVPRRKRLCCTGACAPPLFPPGDNVRAPAQSDLYCESMQRSPRLPSICLPVCWIPGNLPVVALHEAKAILPCAPVLKRRGWAQRSGLIGVRLQGASRQCAYLVEVHAGGSIGRRCHEGHSVPCWRLDCFAHPRCILQLIEILHSAAMWQCLLGAKQTSERSDIARAHFRACLSMLFLLLVMLQIHSMYMLSAELDQFLIATLCHQAVPSTLQNALTWQVMVDLPSVQWKTRPSAEAL